MNDVILDVPGYLPILAGRPTPESLEAKTRGVVVFSMSIKYTSAPDSAQISYLRLPLIPTTDFSRATDIVDVSLQDESTRPENAFAEVSLTADQYSIINEDLGTCRGHLEYLVRSMYLSNTA